MTTAPCSRRPVDRALAVIGLVVASPLLAVAAFVIKASSRGPILFRASRVGAVGRPFTMFKLRTMHHESTGGPSITGGHDSRVFRAGRPLRRLKIDELPQLINVARGDMAIIGPRPEDPRIVNKYYTPMMRRTLDVLPGLASPGSLHYYANERGLPDDPTEAERLYVSQLLPRKLALELVYIENRSVRYDFELVVRAAAGILGIWNIFLSRQRWECEQAGTLLRTELADHPKRIVE